MSAAAEPTPELAIRAKPPSPRRLSRNVLLAGVASAGLIIAFALVNGLSEGHDRREATPQNAVAAAGGPPESIAQAASSYDAADLPRAELDMFADAPAPDLEAPQDPAWQNTSAPPASVGQSGAPAVDPEQAARTAPILFGAHAGAAHAAAHDNDRLDARLTPPRSRYEIQAGQVIPAALVTALNSDLPGCVIAQVTAPVYDSVTGDHLLIPQGSRLVGTYRDGARYGDRRILLIWNRLILPSGLSINLDGMEASDPSGASGPTDLSDYHLDRLAGAIGWSAIISVVANEAEDDTPNSIGQSVGDAAAQQAAQTGGRIIDRELTARPTLTIRAGAPVRVLVTRDIQLRAYRGGGS